MTHFNLQRLWRTRLHISLQSLQGRTRMTEMSVRQQINPRVRSMKSLGCHVLESRAKQIKEALRQGERKPYKDVIEVSWGNPHRAGLRPLSFVRQVLAACFYPELLNGDKLPPDVRQRAHRLLTQCEGGSVGSYTSTAGIPQIVQSICDFMGRRDGGPPPKPENVYISPGSQWAMANIFKMLVNNQGPLRSGLLVPVPGFSTSALAMEAQGAVLVPYHLSEEQGWELQPEELHAALRSAEGRCQPVALYVVNPGNPTGHIQSRESVEEVIRFASENRLVLLADEVYQDCVYGPESHFVSYKKVLTEMGPPYSDSVELVSFHSASKGLMGECGLRGGYVELVNLDSEVLKYIFKVFATDSCAPVAGQFALELMVNPPQPGEPSYSLYKQETEHIRSSLLHNARRVQEVVAALPAISCQPAQAGGFLFPRLHLPPRALRKAKEAGMQPDTFYCLQLLEEAGLLLFPGSDYGQREGSHHIRICILADVETTEEALRRLSIFQKKFMKEFS